ncbi:Phage tail fiber repeat protein [Photorhabdus australis subsp. thailandensis]|uniref:Phage tail fiber repeat protein n=1 Tax=Photorhabdus australis subsp. thailandensis TaxID=2805096 RepID=A0A1C0U442_9GAMM|nr:pyocin knob domain-containing protein [Photorhabdus australis]OCQ52661.1 Phage tail fiber repeat protein [Photorhabdus australis subsp. thailandensis]
MSGQNDFKAFSIGANANVVSQERYEVSPDLQAGFPPNDVPIHLLNKVLRQSSTISAVVANFIATQSGDDILDDGDIAKLTEQLNRALEQKVKTGIPNASLTQKGVVQLTNQAGNSDTLAVTQKLAQEIVNSLRENINSKVPNSRKVNGKALSGDVDITSQDIFGGLAINLGDRANLDSYKTPGIYYQEYNAYAQNGLNYPEPLAGSLMILRAAGIIQRYFVYNSSRIYTRSQYANGAWTPWAREYNTLNKPTAADIDVYTKAEVDSRVNTKVNMNTAGKDINGWWKCGDTGIIYQWGTVNWTGYDTPVNFPIQFPNVCVNVLLTLSHKSDLKSSYNTVANKLSVTGFNYWAYPTEISAFWFAIGY